MPSRSALFCLAAASAVCLALPLAARQREPTEADAFLARKERWAIKTGADATAREVDVNAAQRTTVQQLWLAKRPTELPTNATSRAAQTTRYGTVERTVYTLDVDILRWKREDDRDLHIVVRQHSDTSTTPATLVVEVPDPAVVSSRSPWRARIAAVRAEFDRRFQPSSRFTRRVVHARITGVGYFDFLHGQSGMAPNGLELHPVLKIEYPDGGKSPSEEPKGEVEPPKGGAPTGEPAPGVAADRVWVNLSSGVYWKPGTKFYGKTKRGEYMSEEEAKKKGYRPARGQ